MLADIVYPSDRFWLTSSDQFSLVQYILSSKRNFTLYFKLDKTIGRTPYSFKHYFYARKQLLLSARLSHRNSVCLSVRPSVRSSDTWVDQSKNGAS